MWVVYADVCFLSFDGNALDVAWLALVAALETLTLPTTDLDAETDEVRLARACPRVQP